MNLLASMPYDIILWQKISAHQLQKIRVSAPLPDLIFGGKFSIFLDNSWHKKLARAYREGSSLQGWCHLHNLPCHE
jgi:hypothetical protein